MQFPTKLPTPSSPGISSSEGCSDISSRVGVQTAILEEPHSTSRSSSLPPQSKRGLESEYFAASTMNNDSTLSTSDKEDSIVASPDFVMTDIRKRISCAVRKGVEWEQDLCHLHGLTEAESCKCFSRAAFYLGNDTFPDDATNEKLFHHAKQGWFLLKEVDRLTKTHMKEAMDLDKWAAKQNKPPGVCY